MEAFALYLIKSAVWLTGFTLVYLLFLRNERFFLLNRIYLISGIVVSIVFPFFTWHYTVMLPAVPTVEVSELQMMGTVDISEPVTMQTLLLYIYLAGTLYLLFRVIRQTLAVLRVIRKSEILPYRSAKLIRTTEYPASFSFFSFVFVNPSTCDIETNEIVNHEMEHIRQQHWIDLLLFECLCILQWFNPLSWLYGRLIRQNQEYLADERALQRCSNPGIYRAALLNQMFGGPVISLANSFNYSLNKKRFNMMKKTIYSPIRKLKLLWILPLMAVVFYAFATPEYKYDNGTENQDPKQALYSISKDKIDISFTPQLEKNDLEAIKADLAKLEITIEYTSLDFSDNGKLKQISASIKKQDGSGVTFASGELDPTYYPRYKMDSDGRFGVYNQRSVTGKVISEDGNPLKGASVIISGTTIGTVTDVKGNFKLALTDYSPLVISYVGLETVKLAPDLEKEMLITLKPAIVEIDEVKTTPDSEPLKLLTGIPMIFGNYDGSGAQPLIVKDGFIIVNQDANNINPENIESINVLKGEKATSKYGDKGKNGVVEITIKKGVTSFKKEPIDLHPNGDAKNQKDSKVYTQVEEMPEFPGGDAALRTFIATNVRYPAVAQQKGAQGKVYISFVVSKTGNVTGVKVARGVDASLDQEALRVIGLMPTWKPGKQNGENVATEYTIPINFVLETSKISSEKSKNTSSQSDGVYLVVEQMPEFPGGEEALRKFIAANVKYPAIATQKGIQGKVYITFVVTKTGSVTNTKVARGVDPSLDQEAIRVVESLPTWIPGKQKGVNVDVSYTIPINFVLGKNISDEKLKEMSNASESGNQAPEFTGGYLALQKYLATNVKYPADALQKGKEGNVVVSFWVTKTGEITTAQVSRGLYPSLDKEAIRVIESMPRWKPGMHNNKLTDMQLAQAVEFKLQSTEKSGASQQNEPQAGKLIIVPNPAQNVATVTLVGSESTNKLEVRILDKYGKLVSKESKIGPTFTLSVVHLTTGTYVVVATDGTKQFQGQLVVNH